MIKTIALLASGAAGAGFAAFGLAPSLVCCERAQDCAAAGTFTYVEARDTTVWGGACHVSGDAACYGRRAACAFDFGDARVVLSVVGDRNLQGQDVFRAGGAAEVQVEAWVDADDTGAALARAYTAAPDLPAPLEVHGGPIEFTVDGEAFLVRVPGRIELVGDLMPDRACCTMPESRWYAPIARVERTVVGNAESCRVQGAELGSWAFEGENSVFIARAEG
ncbi:MAG: hypothetical protein AAFP86_05185 [Planctomycetota bacterium]